MAVHSKYIKLLLEKLSERTEESLDYSGLGMISVHVSEYLGWEISHRYLYENIFKRLEKATKLGEEELRISLDRLDGLSQFLGYKNFHHFSSQVDQPIPTALRECLGNWYSYVRCNSGKNRVLVSPVEIYTVDGKVFFKLKGPQRIYKGELFFNTTCIYCFLQSVDRYLQLNFKVGTAIYPKLLQGTFSGISNGGDPICGREILIREERLAFEAMKNRRLDLLPAETQSSLLDARIIRYFETYQGNYIKINHTGSFDLDDLE